MTEVEIGTLLKGQYEVQAKRGEGGMAVLYRAYDRQRRVSVAIKLMKTDFAEDPQFIEKFQREARSLQRLQHPNIVRFYEFGEDGALVFLVLDYIDGNTLRTMIRQRGRPYSAGDVLRLLRPICAALSYAHSLAVVHCDIKPANIMLDGADRVFVTDFGIARFSESATVTFSTPGTALYMAPEQWRGGEDVYPATDVYALGVMLYEMLAGAYPFTGGSVQTRGNTREKIMREHLSGAPPRASQLNPQLAPEFDAVLLRCLEKDPRARFQGADELLAAFESTCNRLNFSDRTAPAAPSGGNTVQLPANGRAHPPVAKRTGIYILLAGVGLVIVFGLAVLVGRGQSHVTAPATQVAAGTRAAATISPVTSLPPSPNVAVAATENLPVTPPEPAATQAGSTASVPSPVVAPVVVETKPPTPVQVIVGRDGMAVLPVAAGEFLMGASPGDLQARPDERPQHRVYLNTFWIDKTEITNAMFAAFLNAQNAWPASEWLNSTSSATQVTHSSGAWQAKQGFDQYPIINVYFDGAAAYCQWAGRRLPSEAEWEKAARGTAGRLYPWGDLFPTGSLANFADHIAGTPTVDNASYGRTTQVGSYPAGASPYSALDMAGNAWEWVADWYAQGYYSSSPASNPRGPSDTGFRVLRGGSWNGGAEYLRTTVRGGSVPALSTNLDFGFRCAANDASGGGAP